MRTIIRILPNNTIIRILLVIAIVSYIPEIRIPLARAESIESVQEDAETGMGGGMTPDIYFQAEFELDHEIEGIPEPEEYSRAQMLTFSSYTLKSGDIIGNIAIMTGLNEDTLLSANNIRNARLLQIGHVLRIPNQDGIYYTVSADDTLESIAQKYNTTVERISTVNELFSDEVKPGSSLFIPGARMDWVNRQEINGDLFIWPVSGYITSSYGYRNSPFTGVRQFHTGLDIGASIGTPIRAAMSGRVSQTGFDNSLGNFVVITHHSGYRTLYAHMNVIRVRAGAYVATGERIGDVGMTGITTGPHLHFTVYKDGLTVNPRSLMR